MTLLSNCEDALDVASIRSRNTNATRNKSREEMILSEGSHLGKVILCFSDVDSKIVCSIISEGKSSLTVREHRNLSQI